MADPEQVPRPDSLLRLTTYGGTELSELVSRCEDEEASAKPVYIRPSASTDENYPSLLHPQLGGENRHPIHKPDGIFENGSSTREEASSDPDEDSEGARHARQNVQSTEEWAPGIPTKGSEGHQFGKCKPCAFVWKEENCKSGIECKFCHICEPGEKKRRKKERHAVARVRTKDYNNSSPFIAAGSNPQYGTQRLTAQPAVDSHYQNKAASSNQYGRSKMQGEFTRKLYLDSLERSESLKQKQSFPSFSSSSRVPLQPLLGVPPPYFPYESDPYGVPMPAFLEPAPLPSEDFGMPCYPVFQEAHARASAAAAAAYQNELAACARYEAAAR